jgi:hypothetical protein
MGHWGARWIGSRLKKEQLDAGFLMWDIRHELDAVVESTVRALTEIWTGDSDPHAEIAAGRVRVVGGGRGGASVWRWLGRSMFAPSRARAARLQSSQA